MGKILNSRKEINDFLKSYDFSKDERLVLEVSGTDKAYVFSKGDYINFDDRWCVYLGFVENPKTIGDIYCLYRIGPAVYYKKPKQGRIDFKSIKRKPKEKEDHSEYMDIPVKSTDNELMIICKELLKYVRVNTFKAMFRNQSDFNNIRRELTSGNGQLTWNRFLLILDLLGYEHSVSATQKDADWFVKMNSGVLEKNKERLFEEVTTRERKGGINDKKAN